LPGSGLRLAMTLTSKKIKITGCTVHTWAADFFQGGGVKFVTPIFKNDLKKKKNYLKKKNKKKKIVLFLKKNEKNY
jgi:hypothetical protein